jgi:hypothetical protein
VGVGERESFLALGGPRFVVAAQPTVNANTPNPGSILLHRDAVALSGRIVCAQDNSSPSTHPCMSEVLFCPRFAPKPFLCTLSVV